jgi:hypothetical protein
VDMCGLTGRNRWRRMGGGLGELLRYNNKCSVGVDYRLSRGGWELVAMCGHACAYGR